MRNWTIINDYEQIIKILFEFRNDLYNKTFTDNELEELARKYEKYAKVIVQTDEDGHNFGFVVMYCNDKKRKIAFISMIAVKHSCRKQGIGKALLENATEIAKENDMNVIQLNVDKKNVSAQNFYTNQNFYVVSQSTKSLVMEKNLYLKTYICN